MEMAMPASVRTPVESLPVNRLPPASAFAGETDQPPASTLSWWRLDESPAQFVTFAFKALVNL
jgi:hypothetical protein